MSFLWNVNLPRIQASLLNGSLHEKQQLIHS